jgi:N-acetylglucosaminyl-diphospho-decaprenol L-rhamnosyltransferase
MSELAVVTVSYGSGEVLPAFLDSLAGASTRPFEVVIADNGPQSGTLAELDRRPHVRVAATGANLGYGRGANFGVALTTSEWVLIANPDIEWQPGSIDELLAAAKRWPGAGSLGPLIRTVDGEIYPSARDLPSLGRGIGHALLGWWWPSNPWTASYRHEREAPREGPAGWLSGSCLLLRRSAFDAVGGFDPSYFMYFEDVDLGERLQRAGWQNVYVPSAEVLHTGGHAATRDPSRMAAEHHRSAWRYLSRRYHGWRWLPVRGLLRVGLAVRSMVAKRVRSVAEGAAPRRREN